MLKALRARWQQGYHTTRFPAGPAPTLPERFCGHPRLVGGRCPETCQQCLEVCPTQALSIDAADASVRLDMGRCIFCSACAETCPTKAITFSREFRLASSTRDALIVRDGLEPPSVEIDDSLFRILGRALKLRQVSAGGCNACEADTNVLTTIGWDLGRFGIQFVASPRHADGLLVTGPVTENMRRALEKTYEAVPHPKLVIAVGSCAISGGPYLDHPEAHNGVAEILPVDVFVPGCPPHPLTILHALLGVVRQLPQPLNGSDQPAQPIDR